MCAKDLFVYNGETASNRGVVAFNFDTSVSSTNRAYMKLWYGAAATDPTTGIVNPYSTPVNVEVNGVVVDSTQDIQKYLDYVLPIDGGTHTHC